MSKKKTVLVVEDEAELNDAYKIILESDGYKVISAFDGSEALSVLKENSVDLILLDLRMPRLDGIGFLQEYKPKGKKPKILVFSNYDMQQEIDDSYRLGADKYILKAWATPRELLQVVHGLLG